MDDSIPRSFESLRQLSPVELTPHRSVHPRPLAPLETPPVRLHEYPPVAHPRSAHFLDGWSVSTHVLPAAFPRLPTDIWSASAAPPAPNETQEQAKQRIQTTVARLDVLKRTQERGEDRRPCRREVLWTVANRYTPTTPPVHGGGLTMVLLHGIGCHKESWEPIMQTLLALRDRLSPGLAIAEFWTLDCVQHGDSAVLNEAVFGDIFDCAEYARDLANFMLWYLPTDAGKPIPTNLPRLAAAEAERRKRDGIRGRTVVGAGHSIGACAYVNPAIDYPNLFSSLIFVEPFTIPEFIKPLDAHRKNETLCMRRQWLWDSRADAAKSIASSPYYRQWDPKMIDAFVEHALTETADGRVRTKTHPVLEASMLFERRMVYEAWEELPRIPARVALHWVWGGTCPRAGSRANQAQTAFRRAANATNDFHPELGHMGPKLLAFDLFRFLVSHYGDDVKSKL
ncbi:Alpha/beta hydrolase family-domain-containing protein [Trametes gibbosa]|nr:Alpha/beta hydrolase family-domain-containing protein [Trametes gibbosa]